MSVDSAVDICNLALDYIGEASIASLETPTNQREEIMARWYDHVRQTLLREYVWNFSLKYDTLARQGDADGDEYTDAYDVPGTCLRIVRLGDDPDNPLTDYQIIGATDNRRIYIDDSDGLPIIYVQDITNVALFDPLFVNLLALRLALKVAYKFTKKKSVVDHINVLISQEEPKAISIDGQERPPRRVEKSKYLNRRRFGDSGRDNRYYEYS